MAARSSRKRSRWRRQLRYFYIRFIRLRGHPKDIARGIAAGVFAGCYPLFGLQTIIGVALAALMRGNKLVAAASTWISNPLTYVPIYAFNYQVGRLLLGQSTDAAEFSSAASFKDWMNLGIEITTALMVGSTVVGSVLGIASYYAGLSLIQRIRRRKEFRRKQNRL